VVAGKPGGPATARVVWARPTSNGGSRITGFEVRALKVRRDGTVVRQNAKWVRGAGARALTMRLRPGRYVFVVRARNAEGWSKATVSVRVRAR
jgi:hypothetical protein